MARPRFIVAVDVGTTTIRACLYNDQAVMVRHSQQPVVTTVGSLHDCTTVEIDPVQLWQQFETVVREVLQYIPEDADVKMGIATQRNSFICWRKDTSEPVTNFTCWNDTRARKKCRQWNRSACLRLLNLTGGVLYCFTRQPRYRAAKMLKFLNGMVSFRLMVQLEQSPELQQLQEEKNLMFGCMDTWLVYKLSKGATHTTEPSNTSATGMFDPFINKYNRFILKRIGFPLGVLVPLGHSASKKEPICIVPADMFGRRMEVTAVLADQQAALFGCGGVDKGDTMISMGTGTFVERNLGGKPHASMKGLYPLVGWDIDHRFTMIAEGQEHNTAVAINWARDKMGLFDDVAKISDTAKAVGTSAGVYYVPAFGGLQTPYVDDAAICGFLGLTQNTTKEHMIRALLEAIAFRVVDIYNTMQGEIKGEATRIRICGGVSANDFVCETIATLIDRPIDRISGSSFAASNGVAMMAGVAAQMWREEDVPGMVKVAHTFRPLPTDREALLATYSKWKLAVKRCLKFYPNR